MGAHAGSVCRCRGSRGWPWVASYGQAARSRRRLGLARARSPDSGGRPTASTIESVLSHRLDDTLLVLTAVSVILAPLALVASIFRMNVTVPGEGELNTFVWVVLLMGVLLVLLVVYFRRRGWL